MSTTRRRVVTAALLLAVGAGIGHTLTPQGAAALPTDPARPHAVVLPPHPCPSEDSGEWCFYDAGNRGNGKGKSFWVDERGQVNYLDMGANGGPEGLR